MSKILVFTATYNEKDNIEKLINVILKLGNDIKMLVIDDKSPDKTYEILEKISKKNDNLIVVKREKILAHCSRLQLQIDKPSGCYRCCTITKN